MTNEPRLVPPDCTARARGLGRWPGAFAPRFFLALTVGLVWLGPAWWDLRFGTMVLAWDALVLAIWWWDWSRLPSPEQLEVSRQWGEPVSLGSSAQVKLEVRSKGNTGIAASLEDEAPASLQPQLPKEEIVVPAGRTGSATYSIQPKERGEARLGRIFIRYRSSLKFAERRAVADLAQMVRVYPDLEEARKLRLYLLRSRQIELEKRLKHSPVRGREFESLREYHDGDEPRDICWTVTARQGRLVTKVYRPERSQSVLLALDAGRLMLAHSGPFTKLDYAVTGALSLAHVAMAGGDAVGVVAYGRKIEANINASRGPSHLRSILDQLALVRGELVEADHARATDALLKRQRRRCLIVWVTDLAETAATPEVIESAMRLIPRHLVLFVVLGQPDLGSFLARRPETTGEMYRYAAGLELVQRRETLLRRMREQGALTLEVAPGRLAVGLVNQYLRIKEESLI
ncbi:MAG: DUF58 domain-containing protein [Acidobacteriota bacterium]